MSLIILALLVYGFWLLLQQRTETQITQTTVSVVQQLQTVRKLETAQMTITKVMEGQDTLTDLIPGVGLDNIINEFLFQDKIVLEVEWIVTAGFDLMKLETGSIVAYKDDSVKIILPPVEILHVKLTEWTKPFDRKLWLLTKGDTQMETKIRNEAKKLLEQDAIMAGILEAAEQSAREALNELLNAAGIIVHELIIQNENTNIQTGISTSL